jgi:uncharacterized membrane protein
MRGFWLSVRRSLRLSLLVATCATTATTNAAATELELINNSPGLSQVTDINNHGHVIGLKDIEIPKVGFMEQSFFWDGQRELAMPQLEAYTNTQCTAIADSGVVAGYAARAFDDERGGMEACLWDTRDNTIVGLGRLEGHRSSHALDISADGKLIVGYSTGRDPATMVPVVWERQDGQWHCQRLSTIHDFNPYLLTGGVVVSDDGTKIAACITVRVVDRPVAKLYESSTFLWRRDDQQGWVREKLTDHQLRMGDVNDSGMLTGSCLVNRERRAFVITADGVFQVLKPLPGDKNAGGTDINNAGTVVGYSDDPHGPVGGPTAFIWSGESAEALVIPGDPFFSWAATINDAGDIAGYLTPRPEAAAESEADGSATAEGQLEQTVSFVLRGAVEP